MSNIKVTIAGRDIKVADGYEKPSAGDVNTCLVSFTIEGGVLLELPNKRVTFYSRAGSVTLDYADELQIPWEVLVNAGALYLTLTGYDPNGNEVARTHHMIYPIEIAKAGLDEGTEPTQPTLDVVSRIDNLASTLEQSETTRQEAFESAQNERSAAFQASMSEWQQDVAESVSQASIATEKANSAAKNANEAADNANNAAANANKAAESANKAAEDIRAAAERGDFDGTPGEPGADGYSPTANVTKVGGTATITVTDKNGTTTATVSDGAPGSDANVTKENVEAALGYEPLKSLSIAGAEVTPIGGVANIPLSNGNTLGVIMTDNINGAYSTGLITAENRLWLRNAENSKISDRIIRVPILANNMDYAVKAAMCDGKGAAWTADEQQAARERMNAADANKVYIMQKQIENLQGIAATEETDSTEAYTKAVPTGAQKWASLDKVGGKTVVWNQAVRNGDFFEGKSGFDIGWWYGNTIGAAADGQLVLTPNKSTKFLDFKITGHSIKPNIKYLLCASIKSTVDGIFTTPHAITNPVRISAGSGFKDCCCIDQTSEGGTTAFCFIAYEPSDNFTVTVDNAMLFDLTAMFGAGNEPSTVEEFRAMFPADYYPYNPGELMSAEVVEVESKGTFPITQSVREMCPGYGWSAGTVCNEIDFGRKVYVQRVGSVDLGTLDWSYDSVKKIFFSAPVLGIYKHTDNSAVPKWLCANYVTSSFNAIRDDGSIKQNMAMGQGFEAAIGADCQCIRDDSYTDAAAFKAAMDGVMLYYELATPIEVDLSSFLPDDNFIEVEAGGTVTFKQASTQLPVPSSVTYQISTSEVIANA